MIPSLCFAGCRRWTAGVVALIAAGEDPRFIARRLIISASEDVGMADPTALQTAVAARETKERKPGRRRIGSGGEGWVDGNAHGAVGFKA